MVEFDAVLGATFVDFVAYELCKVSNIANVITNLKDVEEEFVGGLHIDHTAFAT